MKRYSLLFLLIFFGLGLSAQRSKYEVTYSPVKQFNFHENVQEIIGELNDEVFILKTFKYYNWDTEYLLIDVYSTDMEYRRKIELRPDNEKYIFNKAFMINNRFYVFYRSYDSKEILLHMILFDLEGNIVSKTLGIATAKNESNINDFKFSFSQDTSKIFIGIRPESDGKTKSILKYAVIGLEGTILNTANILVDLPLIDIHKIDYQLDNRGDVYFLVYRSKKKEERVNGESKYACNIYRYIISKFFFEEYKADIGQHQLANIKLHISKKGVVFCTGFYSNNRKHYMHGIFYFELNTKHRSISNIQFHEFENKLLDELKSYKGIYPKSDFSSMKIVDILEKPNGGIYFISEYQSEQTPSNGSSSHFWYRHIVLGEFNEKGNMEKITLIPKRQVTKNDYGFFSSFTYGIKGESLYFIFNDHPKNSTHVKPASLEKTNCKNGILVIIEVKENGEIIKTPLLKSEKDNTVIMPRYGRFFNSDKAVIYCLFNKHFRLVSIDI
jgi:hypothetical protein